ncbi:hypothetical protein C7W93_18895 [Glaciimonas sp. PCH181]|nr:hypothetical protein C7W93_18895 [Glaciimonas sp. PCH181]
MSQGKKMHHNKKYPAMANFMKYRHLNSNKGSLNRIVILTAYQTLYRRKKPKIYAKTAFLCWLTA